MGQEDLFVDVESMLRARQFRMRRLQVLNWGTFSGLHDVPVARDGFLIVGRSGSGKSTLLDAIAALLVPPMWLGFNAAAREGDKGRHDRNLVSYIRGAWADRKDTGSGEIATRYLRTGSTWSAVALELANDAGQTVSLAQIYWLRGTASGMSDVRRHFVIAERPFSLATELGHFDLDLRRLKQRLADVHHYDKFRPYAERFRRLLEIESAMALKLLHKTQSAKNLGDLNIFLREFMLDRPPTFDVAGRLVDEFAELDAAHRAVVTAREQVESLRPARDALERHRRAEQKLTEIERLLGGVDAYRDHCLLELLGAEIERLNTRQQGLAGEQRGLEARVADERERLAALEARHRAEGGGRIEELARRRVDRERLRGVRLTKREQMSAACTRLEWTLPDTPKAYAEFQAQARARIEGWTERSAATERQRDALRDRRRRAADEFGAVRREIEAMRRQPSLIPAQMLDLRATLTGALGLAEPDLPFVGELIEVRDEAGEWRGAIERVLHGFALSMLVADRHYATVSRYVNETPLGLRLVYYRVAEAIDFPAHAPRPGSLVAKLTLADSSYRAWLDAELRRRFDYACVDSLAAFRRHERALTREGQVRHSRARHEKDDRHRIDDRRRWVLGFDNRDKLEAFTARGRALATEISRLDAELRRIEEARGVERERMLDCQTVVNSTWEEIDVAGVLDAIAAIDRELAELRAASRALLELGERVEQQRRAVRAAEQALRDVDKELGKLSDRIAAHRHEHAGLVSRVAQAALATPLRAALATRFEADRALTLANLEARRTRVERALVAEQRALGDERGVLLRRIEHYFERFKRAWPAEGAALDATLASAPEFMTLLKRLEHDGLPRHEQRFFDMLKEQSSENLAALSTHLTQARKEIRERMELVNESLSTAEFNPGTHLRIEIGDRHLPDVREFRERIKGILEHAWTLEREQAEARFEGLRELVGRLAGEDPEAQRWRERVLDVRRHVEFIGREIDVGGAEIEVYRSGAGKSGGQREKLATTCLAAALRYQLGGSEGELPAYAAVVIDEAFAKADNEFTELAMRIFETFGFQMIVATPLKSVMTLEPFIGGACFVDIADRKRSATLSIEYDHERRRLDLPEALRGEAVAARA